LTSTIDVLQHRRHHMALGTLIRRILYNTTPIATNHTLYAYYDNRATAAVHYPATSSLSNDAYQVTLRHTAPRC